MFFHIEIIILTVIILLVILISLTGLYHFSKQEYNNFFVSLLLDEDKLKSLKANKINQKECKKINFILNVQTIFLIVLSMTAMYSFKVGNRYVNYMIIILLFAVKFISNKFIKKIFIKKEI